MKRARLIVLVALVIMALFAAVLPALAGPPNPWDVYNWTFMGDKDGDNVPDKWNVKGDVYRACNHKYTPYTLDACMMVFPPSSSGAALWQRESESDEWIVVTEEGTTGYLGYIYAGAKQLDWDRGYFGMMFYYNDGSKAVVYEDIAGGSYMIGPYNFYTTFSGYGADPFTEDLWSISWGIMMFPGDGYLGVDEMGPWWIL